MNTSQLTYLLQKPEHITKAQTSALEELTKTHPYFQAARALHLKGLKLKESFRYNQELKVTAAYTTDRSILFDYITSEAFNQNEISLAIKHNSEHLKSITVHEHDDISVDKSVTIDEALKQHIKNTEGVLDPNLFENKPVLKSEETSEDKNPALEKDDSTAQFNTIHIESQPEKKLQMGKPFEFDKNETHSFAEWLKITNFKPIKREHPVAPSELSSEEKKNEEKQSQTNQEVNKKFKLIDKFLEANPKIIPTKEASKLELPKTQHTNNDALMTETLARIYLEQKNYEKAIQSYKILSLKYPEKSGFFADQIKAVHQLQDSNTKDQ